METILNPYHVKVKVCCASCQHKEVLKDGSRCCNKTKQTVEATDVCQQWQMSDGLKKVGLQTGAVVRLVGTQEIIIN